MRGPNSSDSTRQPHLDAALDYDIKTQLALQQCFAVIGEAANKVDRALREQHPDVPWREMISMRNAVVHGYWTVSMEIVLDTVRKDLPTARPYLKQMLDALPPEGDGEGDH